MCVCVVHMCSKYVWCTCGVCVSVCLCVCECVCVCVMTGVCVVESGIGLEQGKCWDGGVFVCVCVVLWCV